MKVLVTGSTGQLGKTLIGYKPENIDLIKVSSADFNLLDSKVNLIFSSSKNPFK